MTLSRCAENRRHTGSRNTENGDGMTAGLRKDLQGADTISIAVNGNHFVVNLEVHTRVAELIAPATCTCYEIR